MEIDDVLIDLANFETTFQEKKVANLKKSYQKIENKNTKSKKKPNSKQILLSP